MPDASLPDPADERRVSEHDLVALIGVAVMLETALLDQQLGPDLVASLQNRFEAGGLAEVGGGPAQLRIAVNNLNRRLRYALGELDQPSAPSRGHTDQMLGFATEDAAVAFRRDAEATGEQVSDPVNVNGRAYDLPAHWQVTVRTTEPALTPEFDQHQQTLIALARKHGGQHGGSTDSW